MMARSPVASRTVRPWARTTATLLASIALTSCNLQIGTGIEATDTWTKSYPVDASATLEIAETNGKVRVVGDDVSEIRVTATKHAKAPTEEAAQAAAKDVTIKEAATADRVALDSTASLQMTVGHSRWVDYDITVPRGANVTIKTTNSQINVRDVSGQLQIETTNSDIEALGLGRGADISAANGQITLEMAAIGAAGVRGKLMNGQMIVRLPRDAGANVSARVTNGGISVSDLPLNAEGRRVEGPLNGGGPDVRLELTNGEIRLVGR